MTGMRTSTLYFYVSFSHTTRQEDPVKGTKGKKKKNETRWLGFPKKLAEEASSYITGSGEGKDGGELLGKIKGGGGPEKRKKREAEACVENGRENLQAGCM